jgi:two-component system LytT family response regulator
MTPFKAMSVDDESRAHEALRALLQDVPDIEISAEYASPLHALSALRAGRFELLFLDVAMPEMNGLEVLRALDNAPVTVLMTAHVEHALTAFELGVRDYLLKPISAQRLSLCLDHLRPLLLAARADSTIRAQARLSIKCGDTYQLIDPAQTIRIEAAGNFSTLHADAERVFASESMKELESRLVPCGFLRIHKFHIVNMRWVRTVSPTQIQLENGTVLPIGRAYRGALAEALEDFRSARMG